MTKGFAARSARETAVGALVLISAAGFLWATDFDSATGLDVGANLELARPFGPGAELARGG